MSNSVAERSPAMAEMFELVQKNRALMGGTDAMRKAGEKLLPRLENQSAESYKAQLNGSFLFPGYKDTIEDVSGKMFSKPITVGDAPEAIEEWLKNVDLEGNDFTTFMVEVFKDAVDAGISFIMADAPAYGSVSTKAEEVALNIRPYLVHIRVEDILDVRTSTINNGKVLTHVRIRETVVEEGEDDFTSSYTEQIRVLDLVDGLVQVRLYRKVSSEWTIFKSYPTNLEEIFLEPYYANRTGHFKGAPLFQGVADLNIAHWQFDSAIKNNVKFSLIPILTLLGFEFGQMNDDGTPREFELSSSIALTGDNVDAKAEWVKTDTSAVTTSQALLDKIEDRMKALGMKMLVELTGTATGAVLGSKKETSKLGMLASALEASGQRVIKWLGLLGGVDASSIVVQANRDFGLTPLTAQEWGVLQKDVALGNLSRQQYYNERMRRGVIDDSINIEEDMKLIEEDQDDEDLVDLSTLGGDEELEEPAENPTVQLLEVVQGGR